MCNERYINPFTDFGFKLLFGTPANKEFLITFLNSLFDNNPHIVDISYNNTEIFGPSPDDRKAVYDLYCETSDGTHIIVEMQNAYQRYFLDRTIFYSSFPMQAVAKRGEWDYRLPPIYTISFLNFNMPDYVGDPNYKHVVRLMDERTHKVFFDKLTYIYLEMPKFNKDENDLNGYAECWLYIIKNLVLLNERPAAFRDKVFERFFRVAEIARFTPEERAAYETSLKNMRDYNNTVRDAEDLGMQKGMQKGMQEGMQKGMQKGMTKGIEVGRVEEKKLIAHNLKNLNVPIDKIIESTGLSESEIIDL